MKIPIEEQHRYIVTQEDLKNLLSGYGGKMQNYLHNHYSGFTQQEIEETISDSIKTLYEKSLGEDFHLTSALEALFFGICKNKAKEVLRKKLKMPLDEGASEVITGYAYDGGRINNVLAMDDSLDDDEKEYIWYLVDHLPYPCDNLLGGFYRTGYNLKELSKMLDLPYDVVKKKISRCRKKFKDNYLRNV